MKYDIRLIHVDDGAERRLDLTDSSGASFAVTGLEKTIQKFLLRLLTATGSSRARPTYGSNFLLDAMQGRWRTSFDVLASFAAAEFEIRDQLIREETDATPVAESYGGARGLSAELRNSGVSLRISVESADGQSRIVETAIPYFPR